MSPKVKAPEERDAVFWLRVHPRASRERLRMDASGDLRLDVHAPPREGQSNQACLEFLAKVAGVARSRVEIVTGAKARRKLIRIHGGEDVWERIRSATGQGRA